MSEIESSSSAGDNQIPFDSSVPAPPPFCPAPPTPTAASPPSPPSDDEDYQVDSAALANGISLLTVSDNKEAGGGATVGSEVTAAGGGDEGESKKIDDGGGVQEAVEAVGGGEGLGGVGEEVGGRTGGGEGCVGGGETGEKAGGAGNKDLNEDEEPVSSDGPKRVSEIETAHLHSSMSWADLKLGPELLKGVLNKGFEHPSKIQAMALPEIIGNRRNIIAQAQNGSGKTATFALAMLSRVNQSNREPQCLCLCPTRELATQNVSVIRDLGKFTQVTAFLAVPQCPRYDKMMGAHIVVGTPGKTLDFLKKRIINANSISMFVLDEADEMIDPKLNMQPQVQNARSFLDPNVQILLFSATYEERVKTFAEETVPNPIKIQIRKEALALKYIMQFYRKCRNDDDKKVQLADLYACMTIGQSIVFVNSRQTAFSLSLWMKEQGHQVTLICGSKSNTDEQMDHSVRDEVMQEFRKGETKVLITTDVLSRGIDVPQVTMVVNYDLPRSMTRQAGYDGGMKSPINMETYLHRIGRTGRFGLKGIAVSLLTEGDLLLLDHIKSYYECEINELPGDPEEIDDMLHNMRK
eukprot:GHVQ01007195.1.p1 GENE.GHVQ01007195.1~~GHVQ01007195.1.p1  ORF type:complete len:580 (-),score=105.95 GHVQ01007195.1:490-2229(-)